MSKLRKAQRMAVQVTVWKPEYYLHLYDELIKEIKYINENTDVPLPVKKWKVDLLIHLLELSQMPLQTNKKALRKRVKKDIRGAEEIAEEGRVEKSS